MKTIYAQACPGSVVLQEKELPAPGPGQLLLEAQYSTMSPGTENGLMGEHIVPLPTSIGYSTVSYTHLFSLFLKKYNCQLPRDIVLEAMYLVHIEILL